MGVGAERVERPFSKKLLTLARPEGSSERQGGFGHWPESGVVRPPTFGRIFQG